MSVNMVVVDTTMADSFIYKRFFALAKEAGFEIWCDPRIRVGHEKIRVI